MKQEINKEKRRTIPTVSRVLPNGDLVELVYDAAKRRTALAVGSRAGYT